MILPLAEVVGICSLAGWLRGDTYPLGERRGGRLSHGEIEERLEIEGRELLRQLLHDHLNRRPSRRPAGRRSLTPRGCAGERRTGPRAAAEHDLRGGRGEPPRLSAAGPSEPVSGGRSLNLSLEKHFDGLGRLPAVDASRRSFESAAEAIEPVSRVRPTSPLVTRCSCDFGSAWKTLSQVPCGQPWVEGHLTRQRHSAYLLGANEFVGRVHEVQPEALRALGSTARALGRPHWRRPQQPRCDLPEALARVEYVPATMRTHGLVFFQKQ